MVDGSPVILTSIFTEAQSGRERLDTRFSYVNFILKEFIEERSVIILDENIVHALSFCGGVAETKAVLLDTAYFPGAAI